MSPVSIYRLKNRIINDPGYRQAAKTPLIFSSLLAPKFVDISPQAGLLAQVHSTIRPFPGYPSGFSRSSSPTQ